MKIDIGIQVAGGSACPRLKCAPPGSGVGVQGSRFGDLRFMGVYDLRFRVQGAGCRVHGSGFRVRGSGFRVHGPWFIVHGSGLRAQGSGSQLQGRDFVCDAGLNI